MKGLTRGWTRWLMLLPLLAGCAGTAPAPEGDGATPSAMAPQVAFEGEYNEACFSDDLLDLSLLVREERPLAFVLTLANKTGAPLRVLWDQAVFLDASGNAQHLIHQGVAHGQPLEALTPTSVETGATLGDLLLPAKAVLEEDVWRLAPLSGGRGPGGPPELRLRIDLPLEMNGRTSIYRFRFHLENPEASQEDGQGQRP
ncbi:MAG: hypothetical protein HY910_06795 [Desulfarculus sp.]|nr:hypothetical protein [Desulfarculus sp.]